MQQEKTYTIPEYAADQNVNKATVYRWIKTKRVETVKDGSKTLIVIREHVPDVDLSQVVALLREQIQAKDQQIKALLEQNAQLQDSTQQQNAIIMQMARNTETEQKLLEHRRKPFYRRWFDRRQDDTDAALDATTAFDQPPYDEAETD